MAFWKKASSGLSDLYPAQGAAQLTRGALVGGPESQKLLLHWILDRIGGVFTASEAR